jgi:hypothetical protein
VQAINKPLSSGQWWCKAHLPPGFLPAGAANEAETGQSLSDDAPARGLVS